MVQSEYSETPLAKKLGIKKGFKIGLVNEPENYFRLIPLLLNLKKQTNK